MRIATSVCLACLAAAALAFSGCGPARPMTSSEFRGFCYQSQGSMFRTSNVNSISECNAYATVTQTDHASLRDCLAGCAAVQAQQYVQCKGMGCASVNYDARSWCDRYCRTNYPK